MLKTSLEHLLIVQISDDQWQQESLPAHMGGLGVRSACMQAPSAFLASDAAMLPLQEAVLSASSTEVEDTAVNNTKSAWTRLASSSEPSDTVKHIQRPWDAGITTAVYNNSLEMCSSSIDQAWLKAKVTSHAGDWLNALPLDVVGLILSDEAIRIENGYRLVTVTSQPHTCICGALVDARGLHSLACHMSSPHHI